MPRADLSVGNTHARDQRFFGYLDQFRGQSAVDHYDTPFLNDHIERAIYSGKAEVIEQLTHHFGPDFPLGLGKLTVQALCQLGREAVLLSAVRQMFGRSRYPTAILDALSLPGLDIARKERLAELPQTIATSLWGQYREHYGFTFWHAEQLHGAQFLVGWGARVIILPHRCERLVPEVRQLLSQVAQIEPEPPQAGASGFDRLRFPAHVGGM